jgi:hypothetical protein
MPSVPVPPRRTSRLEIRLDRISFLSGYIQAASNALYGDLKPGNDAAIKTFAERAWKATGAERGTSPERENLDPTPSRTSSADVQALKSRLEGERGTSPEQPEGRQTVLRRVQAKTISEGHLLMVNDIVRRVFAVRPGIDGKQVKLDIGDRWQPFEAEEGVWLVIADDQLPVDEAERLARVKSERDQLRARANSHRRELERLREAASEAIAVATRTGRDVDPEIQMVIAPLCAALAATQGGQDGD